ncbi:MAG: hypothetical protein ACKVP4_04875 [Hyphomicrobium sp.]
MKSMFAAVAAGFALVSLASSVQAAPAVGGGLKAAIADEARMVEKTHGVHRYCARGPAGWHRHRWGRRISCRWWRNRWH